ncbi:MAG: hypothetical protein AB4911_06010 [Oscillochloridaceae bacterium umkhey_bin13]
MIIADGHAITLRMARRDHLAQTAILAGDWLVERDLPLLPLLILAVMALQGSIPDVWQLTVLRRVVDTLPPIPFTDPEPMSLRTIRTFVRSVLTNTDDDPKIDLGGDRWCVARMLCVYGEMLWTLRGADAARWGTLPITSPTDPPLLRVLVGMAGVLYRTGMEQGRVSIPLAEDGHPTDAIIDWLALVSGPEQPLRDAIPSRQTERRQKTPSSARGRVVQLPPTRYIGR